MHKLTLPGSGTSTKRRLVAAAATTAVAIGVAGLGSVPAQSAPDPACPSAFPLASTVRDLAVTGLTVTSGTTPEQFDGKVLGILDNGIAPGVPMIMVQVTSDNIAKHGIWQGMSGSPVYAPDGRLIGAVSYGLSASPSPIAGVTPAADMQALLSSTPATAAPATGMATHVSIPQATARTMVASGAATRTEAAGGFSRLKTPFVISSMGSSKRLDQLAAALQRSRVVGHDVTTMAGGAVTSAAQDIPVDKPGGNLAASVSYGDVTTAGIGTATEICGNEVIGFGHPMNFDGTSTMTMHGADAITIYDDSTFGGFKLANLGAPVGGIDQDHLAGIHGVVGPTPAVSPITSSVTVGAASRTGQTLVSVPKAVPDIALGHVVSDQDRVLDSVGGGSGTLSYTVKFTRADGTQQSMTRGDVFADPNDISYGDVFDLANLLYTLGSSGLEDVKISSVTTKSHLSHTYQHYTLTKVELRRDGAWRTLDANRVLALKPGTLAKFRISLSSSQVGNRVVTESVPVPPLAGNKVGALQVFGGNSVGGADGSGDVFVSGKQSAADNAQPTLDDLLTAIRRAPHHDAVVVDMTWFNQRGQQTNHKVARTRTGTVVDGTFSMMVRGIPRSH